MMHGRRRGGAKTRGQGTRTANNQHAVTRMADKEAHGQIKDTTGELDSCHLLRAPHSSRGPKNSTAG